MIVGKRKNDRRHLYASNHWIMRKKEPCEASKTALELVNICIHTKLKEKVKKEKRILEKMNNGSERMPPIRSHYAAMSPLRHRYDTATTPPPKPSHAIFKNDDGNTSGSGGAVTRLAARVPHR